MIILDSALPAFELIFSRNDGLAIAIHDLESSLETPGAAECSEIGVVGMFQINSVVFDKKEETVIFTIVRHPKVFSLFLA